MVLLLAAILPPLVCPVASTMPDRTAEWRCFMRCLGGTHSACSLHMTSGVRIALSEPTTVFRQITLDVRMKTSDLTDFSCQSKDAPHSHPMQDRALHVQPYTMCQALMLVGQRWCAEVLP